MSIAPWEIGYDDQPPKIWMYRARVVRIAEQQARETMRKQAMERA